MPIRTKEPIEVKQLGGTPANLFRVTGYSYSVVGQPGRYHAIFDVGCQADLIVAHPYEAPPTQEQVDALEAAVDAIDPKDEKEYEEACLRWLGAKGQRERDTGPPAPDCIHLGGWSEVIDIASVPGFTVEASDHDAMFQKLEAHLTEAGIFPAGETI